MLVSIRPKVMVRLAVCYLEHRAPKFIAVIQGHVLHSGRYIANVRKKGMTVRFGNGRDFTFKNYLIPTKP